MDSHEIDRFLAPQKALERKEAEIAGLQHQLVEVLQRVDLFDERLAAVVVKARSEIEIANATALAALETVKSSNERVSSYQAELGELLRSMLGRLQTIEEREAETGDDDDSPNWQQLEVAKFVLNSGNGDLELKAAANNILRQHLGIVSPTRQTRKENHAEASVAGGSEQEASDWGKASGTQTLLEPGLGTS